LWSLYKNPVNSGFFVLKKISNYLYILQSINSNKYYVGISDKPQRRLIYHNSIEKGFTARYRPWEIKFIKEYPNKIDAENRNKNWDIMRLILMRLT